MNNMINTQGKSNRQPMPPRRPTGPSRPEMKAPPDLDSILSELGANNNSVNNLDLSSGELSESDTDGIKNLNIGCVSSDQGFLGIVQAANTLLKNTNPFYLAFFGLNLFFL